MTLTNLVALVTGAQQGIGRAAAIALAAAGADIAVNWLDDEATAQEVADAVRQAGRQTLLLRADVSDIAAGAKMVAQAAAHFGRFDILVNNAGIYPRAAFLNLPEAVTWPSSRDG